MFDRIFKNIKKPDESNPVFNAGVDYLQRISELIRLTHKSMIEDDRVMAYNLLVQLETEIMPRMNKEELGESAKYNKRIRFIVLSHAHTKPNLLVELRKWFNFLNKVIHEKGLILPNHKDGE